MTTVSQARPRPAAGSPAGWMGLSISLALVLGLAAASNTRAAAALAILTALAAATALKRSSIVIVLMLSVFLETLSLGGVTASRLIAPLALLVLIFEWLRGNAVLRPGPQLIPVVAYSCWALASTLWTNDSAGTISLLASLLIALVYMMSFAMLVDSEDVLRAVLYVTAGASLVVGAYAAATFAGATGSTDDLQGGRAQGAAGDPNFFASLQLIVMPLILVIASDTRKQWLRYLLYAAVLVGLTSILSTLSRGALIALVTMLAILPFIPSRALLGTQRQKALVLLVIAIGTAVLFTRAGFREEVVGRAKTTFVGSGAEGGSSSGSGRGEIWKAARHAASDFPVHGVGFGAFPSVSNEYLLSTPGVNLENFAVREGGIEAHSAYFGTAAELGYIGLALFLSIVFATAYQLRRTAVRAFQAGADFVGRVANACLLSMLAWAMTSLFIETETSRPLWILVGLSLALPRLIARPRTPQARADAQD